MPRLRFVLFFSTDPPAADLLREDALVAADNEVPQLGQTRRLLREPDVEGQILRVGTKASLSKLVVTSTGEVFDNNINPRPSNNLVIGTRKKEIARLAKESANPKEAHLQQLAASFMQDGLDGLSQKRAVSRRPRQRTEDALTEIRSRLTALPCWKKMIGDVELTVGSNVYINASTLLFLQSVHEQNPEALFRAILFTLLTKELLAMDGLSWSGSRDSVEVPKNIVSATLAFVKVNAKRKLRTSVDCMVRNVIYYQQRKKLRLNSELSYSSPSSSSSESSSNIEQPSGDFVNSPETSPPGTMHDVAHTGLDSHPAPNASTFNGEQLNALGGAVSDSMHVLLSL